MHFHTLLSEELQKSFAFGKKVDKERVKHKWRKIDRGNWNRKRTKNEKYGGRRMKRRK